MKIKNNIIKNISIIYALLPVIIFMLGWLKLYISIPIVISSLIVLYKYMLSNKDDNSYIQYSKKTVIIIIVIAIVWVFFSGIGKLFYQSTMYADNIIRDSIYKDLIFNKWPIVYDGNLYLCYYIGHWLVPAFISKILNYIILDQVIVYAIGNVMLYIWSVIGIILLFIWICKIISAFTIKKVITTLIMFVFFSGLDVIGYIVIQKYVELNCFEFGYDWWCNWGLQYSSFNSLLFWVYNQMITPMIIISLVICEENYNNRIFLIVIGMLFGPLPILGLILWIITKDIIKIIKSKSIVILKDYISIQNILSLIFILPVFVLYYLSNARVDSNLIISTSLKIPENYIIFVIIEFLVYLVLIFNSKDKEDIIIIAIHLLIIPIIGNVDFIMRVSIPFIYFMWIKIMKNIYTNNINKYKKVILCVLLCIAALNPMADMYRVIREAYFIGTISSKIEEVDITKLDIYYVKSYTSDGNSVFFKYLAKKK